MKSTSAPGFALCSFCGCSIRQICGNTSNLLKHLLSRHSAEYKAAVGDYDEMLKITCESQSPLVSTDISLRWSPSAMKSSAVKLPAGGGSRPKKRSKSLAWNYFERCDDDMTKAECMFCRKVLKQAHGSTSNLLKHLCSKHPVEYAAIMEDVKDSGVGPTVAKLKTEIQGHSPVAADGNGMKYETSD